VSEEPRPDDGAPPSDLDHAVDHLHVYLERKLPDLTAEHMLEDLGVVERELTDRE
jgi:hypothetical protein